MRTQQEKYKLVQRIIEISNKLGIAPVFPMEIGLSVMDQNGREVNHFKEVGHSWTRNAWNLLFTCFTDCGGSGEELFGAGYMTAKQSRGGVLPAGVIHYATERCWCNGNYQDTDSHGFCNNWYVSNDYYGILAGSSDEPFDVDQYELEELIPYNILNYRPMARSVSVYSEATKTWTVTHSRQMINSSGDDVTVRELGLYWEGYLFIHTAHNFMMARDVITPITLENGQSLYVDYNVTISFAEID